jgi:hypothetical protein
MEEKSDNESIDSDNKSEISFEAFMEMEKNNKSNKIDVILYLKFRKNLQ